MLNGCVWIGKSIGWPKKRAKILCNWLGYPIHRKFYPNLINPVNIRLKFQLQMELEAKKVWILPILNNKNKKKK